MQRVAPQVLLTWPTGLCVGAAAGFMLVLSTMLGPKIAAIFALGLPCALLIAKSPGRVFLLFLFLLLVIEEFPGLLGASVERFTRTPFYSLSLGVKGVSTPDVFLLGLIMAYLFRHLLVRDRIPIVLDKIFVAMFIFGVMLVVSTINSFVTGDPFKEFVSFDVSSTGGVHFNEAFARLIGFFQIKQFSILIVSYVVGMFYFRTVEDVRKLFPLLKLALVVILLIGFLRLTRFPELVVNLTPIFYDTPTIWLFSAILFYCICVWVMNEAQPKPSIVHLIVLVLMVIFILTSFRRAMWGGIIISSGMLVFLLPAGHRGRYLLFATLGILSIITVLTVTPAGQAILTAVSARIGETTTAEASTLYRFAMHKHLVENFWDIPMLGHGVTPLWGEKLLLREFISNLENVHSLYIWVLLRLGLVGFLFYAFATMLVLNKMLQVYWTTRGTDLKILLLCLILLVLMFLFSGLFNPVYAESRYIFILGFAMAVVSRLGEIAKTADITAGQLDHTGSPANA